jgi:hypothetical protein
LLQDIVRDFPGLFDLKQQRTNVLCKTVHTIDIGENQPVKQPSRRHNPAQTQAIKEFLKANLDVVIQKGTGPWASPLLLTPKKSPGSYIKPKIDLHTIWRICTDYRELNRRTTKNAHPLPYAMDQIQRAAGHMWYCFLDLKDGFWHIKIAEKD